MLGVVVGSEKKRFRAVSTTHYDVKQQQLRTLSPARSASSSTGRMTRRRRRRRAARLEVY
jgi:hypothetical protein